MKTKPVKTHYRNNMLGKNRQEPKRDWSQWVLNLLKKKLKHLLQMMLCWGSTRLASVTSRKNQSSRNEGNVDFVYTTYELSSVQFSRSVVSSSLRPHESQHARPLCPSPPPRVYSDSRPSSQWCHPAISSSVVLFSSDKLIRVIFWIPHISDSIWNLCFSLSSLF